MKRPLLAPGVMGLNFISKRCHLVLQQSQRTQNLSKRIGA